MKPTYAQTFHLSPTGDDSHSHGPWATLAGARDALRVLRRSGELQSSARVEVAAGTYSLTQPVLFEPEDSHTAYVAAGDEAPIIEGGRAVTDWTETQHNGCRAWKTTIPEVATGSLNLRSLFVDGQRRFRARFPKFAPDAAGVKNTFRMHEIRFPERQKLFDGDHMFKPRPGDVQDWPSLRHAEIVVLHYWLETRLPQPHFDPETGWVDCARRSVFNLYESFKLEQFARYYIDNLFEALTEPGEWYVDRASGHLTYLPFPGETIEQTRVTIPLVTRFIIAEGHSFNRNGDLVHDAQGTRYVEQLTFEGLAFQHADWYQPGSELLPHHAQAARGVTDVPLGSSVQAAAHVPASVLFRWSRGCRFHRCAIRYTGFYAIEVGGGCREIDVSHNMLQDIGGGGVKIGGTEIDGPIANRTSHVNVMDNTIHRVGRVFHQSCGILLTHAFSCTLAHNEIAHTCYTGISVGWSWGYRETITRNLLIENNLVRDICEGILSDNGGIYLLGVQPGTVVRGNHIYRVTAADYGGWGIYPDEGSAHMVFEHNWVHDTSGSLFSIHFGRELVVRHNVFARSGQAFFRVSRADASVAANLSHNVFLGPSPSSFHGGYAGDIRQALESNANIFGMGIKDVPPLGHPYRCADGQTKSPTEWPFAAWQKAGHDRLSLFLPIDVEEHEDALCFPENSPATQAGFKPYDWSVCGPRPIVADRK